MSGHRTVRAAWAAVLLAGVAGALAPALAQVPPGHRLPPPDPSGPPPMAAPSAPDTAVIAFTVPDSLPAPTAVHAVQDSLDFGGLLHLVWDYPAGTATADLPAPASDGTWLEPAPTPRAGLLARLLGRDTGLPSLDELPPAAGERVVRSYRVFRREPLRVAWGDDVSGVITVRGQTADAEQTATIRQPRPLRWRPWTLVALLAGVLLLALLLWLLWRRRRAPAPLADWTLAPPAWLAAATGLRALLDGPELARGDTRAWLDGLAVLARDYVAARYRVAARELTGNEIARACVARGHAPGHPTGFGRLIDLADRERYNPEPPDTSFCREQAVQFFGRLARVRVASAHVPVPAAQRTAADAAWRSLAADLGTGAGREVRSAGPGGGR